MEIYLLHEFMTALAWLDACSEWLCKCLPFRLLKAHWLVRNLGSLGFSSFFFWEVTSMVIPQWVKLLFCMIVLTTRLVRHAWKAETVWRATYAAATLVVCLVVMLAFGALKA